MPCARRVLQAVLDYAHGRKACSGTVTPDGAVVMAASIYIGVLILACGLANPLLRFAISAAAIVTLLYTPVLKRITAVKNLAVAFVISASPLCGAIASGMVCFHSIGASVQCAAMRHRP